MEAFALLREELRHVRSINADLLEALRLMLADFEDYPASEHPCLAFTKARAAIAKALGQEETT